MTPEFKRGFDAGSASKKIPHGANGEYRAGYAKGENYSRMLKKNGQQRIATSCELMRDGQWSWSVSKNGIVFLTGIAATVQDADKAAQAAAQKPEK